VGQLLERHLRESVIEPTTRSTYEGYIYRHVLPFTGSIKVSTLDPNVFDSFYAKLSRELRPRCQGLSRKRSRQWSTPAPGQREMPAHGAQ
jgi:integrase